MLAAHGLPNDHSHRPPPKSKDAGCESDIGQPSGWRRFGGLKWFEPNRPKPRNTRNTRKPGIPSLSLPPLPRLSRPPRLTPCRAFHRNRRACDSNAGSNNHPISPLCFTPGRVQQEITEAQSRGSVHPFCSATSWWCSRSMDTLHPVAHDDEQTRPIALRELPERSHDPRMNPLLVGLSQTHNQDAVVLLVAVL